MKTLQEVLMDKKRTYIMLFFLISIFVLLIVMAANKDTLFKRIDKVTYSNNCSETYINGKLNSSKCPDLTTRYPDNIINLTGVINITNIVNETIAEENITFVMPDTSSLPDNETLLNIAKKAWEQNETIINITDLLNLTGINLTDNQTDLIPILAE